MDNGKLWESTLVNDEKNQSINQWINQSFICQRNVRIVAITRVPVPAFNFWVSKAKENAMTHVHTRDPITKYFAQTHAFSH